MDSEQFTDLIVRIDDEMNEISGELYGATQDALPENELKEILERGEKLLTEYRRLKTELRGGKLEELTGYEEDMDLIDGYIKALKGI